MVGTRSCSRGKNVANAPIVVGKRIDIAATSKVSCGYIKGCGPPRWLCLDRQLGRHRSVEVVPNVLLPCLQSGTDTAVLAWVIAEVIGKARHDGGSLSEADEGVVGVGEKSVKKNSVYLYCPSCLLKEEGGKEPFLPLLLTLP